MYPEGALDLLQHEGALDLLYHEGALDLLYHESSLNLLLYHDGHFIFIVLSGCFKVSFCRKTSNKIAFKA